jgi:hypothetical protein
MAQVALDIELALRIWRANNVVSAKRAHKLLHSMRAARTLPGPTPAEPQGYTEETVDMTEDQDFDWRGYVANRKSEALLRELVGEGITRFEMRFLTLAWDTNLNQHRCDFVAHRVDNTCVRFHPSASGDTVPVIGRMADWCGNVLPATTMERVLVAPPPAAPQGDFFRSISQSDVIGKKVAQEFLDTVTRGWEGGPRNQAFATDLTSQAWFPWTLYLASTPWGRRMYNEGISEVHLVWLGPPYDKAAFYVLMEDRRECVIRPSSTRNPPVSEQDVQYIQW